MGRKTRSKNDETGTQNGTNSVDQNDIPNETETNKITPKKGGRAQKRGCQEISNHGEEQPLSKQNKKSQKGVKEVKDDHENESDCNNNASIDNEVIVGTTKSLISSLKKRKTQVHKGRQDSDPEPGTSGQHLKVAKKHKNKTGREEKEKDGIDMTISGGSSEDEYSRELENLKKGKREKSSRNDKASESEISESEDPDVDKLDFMPRKLQYVYTSSSDDLDYSDYDQQSDAYRQSQTSSQSESDSQSELSTGEDELDQMRKDPKVKRLLSELMEEERAKSKKSKARKRRHEAEKRREHDRRRKERRRQSMERQRHHKKQRGKRRSTPCDDYRRGDKCDGRDRARSSRNGKVKVIKDMQRIKSPSDTTIYAPGLVKDVNLSPLTRKRIENNVKHANMVTPKSVGAMTPKDINTPIENVIDQISDFVENMRIRSSAETERRSDQMLQERDYPRNERDERGDTAKTMADSAILDAEKFRASINNPKGNDNEINSNLKLIADSLNKLTSNEDDDFFHVTCHVDHNLRSKIEKGEFVDLDKLIPKNRNQIMSESNKRMQLMVKDGQTYIGTPDHEAKINSIRKWEQAFRVYAAIYSKANPHRAAEIWQYVHVINTAAASYVWENVYYYDITFRQLMHSKPKRSWAKTYNQLWNIAMCEPIVRNNFSSNNYNNHQKKSDHFNPETCCWRWNKGKCKKWNCKFEHRCKYCGSYSHIANACYKKKSKKESGHKDFSPKKEKPTHKH